MLTTPEVYSISRRLLSKVKSWGLGDPRISGKLENGSLYVELVFPGKIFQVAKIRVSTHKPTSWRIAAHQIEYVDYQSEGECLTELKRQATLLACGESNFASV